MRELHFDEIANFVSHGDRVAFGGFTPAGCPKVCGLAIANKAREEHLAGHEFGIHVIAGASMGDTVESALVKEHAVISRTPYQSNANMRHAINAGEVHYWDMHVSHFVQQLKQSVLGNIDLAVIEAADVTSNGEIVLTTGVGISNVFCQLAKHIIIEINEYHPTAIRGLHDICDIALAPNTLPIPLTKVNDRIGTDIIKVDKKKILGAIRTDIPDEAFTLSLSDDETDAIGANVAKFLANEIKNGQLPKTFLPIQSGVGNIANAVLYAMSQELDIPPFTMFSEVLQDAVIDAMKDGKITYASACALAVTEECLRDIYNNLAFFKERIVLRTEEITNHPEIALRLGLIAINTALEADITGNVNSTHVLGKNILNGIGGAADFSRNSQISIFTCKSTAKNGTISTIVPLCSHIDHSEHSVKVLITEQGIADLRGKDPWQRAHLIIENCAHPTYRELLRDYVKLSHGGHQPFSIKNAFGMHQAFIEYGDMRAAKWSI